MAIDIRAEVSCSLGTVISGSFADDYLQGNGLIKTRGEVLLAGTLTPKVGTKVTFTYVKNGTTYSVPRALRVLSSFADPFRRTTAVQLGCKLTYLENRKPPVEKPNAKDEHETVPCKIFKQANIPISASYVFNRCLNRLDLTSDAIPLTNKFSVEEFDLTPGYVQVMSDLLVSEGYVGYLNKNEVLKFINMTVNAASGPLFSSSDIADLGPIGSGSLPGESVVVRWSNQRLLPPKELEEALQQDEDKEAGDTYLKRSWELEETFGAPSEVVVRYENDAGEAVTATDFFYPYTFSATRYDVLDRKIESATLTLTSSAEVNNRWASDAFKLGKSWNLPVARLTREVVEYFVPAEPANAVSFAGLYGGSVSPSGIKYALSLTKDELVNAVVDDTETAKECKDKIKKTPEEETGEDDDAKAIVKSQTTFTYSSELELAGSLNLDTYIDDNPFLPSLLQFSTVPTETDSIVEVTYETDEATGVTKTITKRYISRSQTITGQQDLAARAQDIGGSTFPNSFAAAVESLLGEARRQVYVGAEVNIRTQREYGLQKRPSETERNNKSNSKSSNAPSVTESRAGLTWVTGSTTSKAVREFTLPYAPDDEINWSEEQGFTSVKSDAKQKAMRFGRIQNALLLGNRSGVSLQLTPERLPKRPFDPIYVEAAGITGCYRVNGTSWAFDSNGIVASTDALFWGAVSAASSADLSTSWVPLAPDTTSLPLPYAPTAGAVDSETGATFSAMITPATVLPPYVESVELEGITVSSITITEYPYTLNRGTETQVAATRTRLVVGSKLTADLGSYLLSGQPAALAYRRAIRAAASSFATTGYSAGSIRDYAIGTNAGTFALAGQNAIVKYQRTPLAAAGASLTLTGEVATFFKGATLPAAAASYTASGADASLRASRILNAAAGDLALTGQAADLDFVLPSDPYFSSVQLLLKGEGADGASTITDLSLKARTPATNSGAITSTAQFKFGASSLYFNAVSIVTQRGFTYSIASDDRLGTGDYTIEMFFRINAAGELYQLFAIGTFSGFLQVDSQGSIRWLTQVFTPPSPVAANTWYHLAAVRSSSSVMVFLDGTQIGSTITNTRNHTSPTWYVGRDYDSDRGLYGYIDELRVTKGVARYTSNFTPPTQTFPEQ